MKNTNSTRQYLIVTAGIMEPISENREWIFETGYATTIQAEQNMLDAVFFLNQHCLFPSSWRPSLKSIYSNEEVYLLGERDYEGNYKDVSLYFIDELDTSDPKHKLLSEYLKSKEQM